MNSIEIKLGSQTFVISSDSSPDELKDVTELVRRRMDAITKKLPSSSFQKLLLLTSLELASELIGTKKKAAHFRTAILGKAQEVLHKVQATLPQQPNAH